MITELIYFSGINYPDHQKTKLVELDFKRNNIIDTMSFIEKINIFVEIIGHLEMANVIINLNHEDLIISKSLRKYFKEIIIKTMFKFNVQRIYLIVTGAKYHQ